MIWTAHNAALYGPNYLLGSRNLIDADSSYHINVLSKGHKVNPEININTVFGFAVIFLICSIFPFAEYSAALMAAVITDL